MCHASAFNNAGAVQFNWRGGEVVEQSYTCAKQHGNEVDMYLVNQSSIEALLRDGPTAYRNTLTSGDFPGLFNGAFDAVRDEREGRPFLEPLLRDAMGNNHHRYIQRMFATPGMRDVKCPASVDQCPDCLACVLKHFGAV